jgi:hypothetical protein
VLDFLVPDLSFSQYTCCNPFMGTPQIK